jgi:hypothetical protein
MLLPMVCGVSLCCASSAPAVARGWQQTTTILNQCGTWARGFPMTPLQTPLHMSALRGGTHAAPWKPRASAGAHRSHRAYGRSCSRRAHHLRRWQKNVEAVAGWQIRMPSSMGTRAASLRHDAHQGDDSTGFATNLPQEVADTLRVHGIIRPRDRCEREPRPTFFIQETFLSPQRLDKKTHAAEQRPSATLLPAAS